MKLVFKTLTGATTVKEFDPSVSVGDVKDVLGEEYDRTGLKLCYKGKVLEDAKTLGEYDVKENDTVIIAGKKKALVGKPAPAPETTTAPKPAESAPPAPPAPAPTPATTAPAPEAPPASTAAAPPAPPAPPAPASPPAQQSAGVTAGADPAAVEMIMGMGFPDKEEVTRALRAAFGNADRAVEYLCTGIPANAGPPPPQAGLPAGPPAPSAGGAGGAGGASAEGEMSAEALGQMLQQQQMQRQGAGGGGGGLRAALAAIPQFAQIQQLVRTNPQVLPTVMQQLQERHPEVFALIQANPSEFLEVMNSGGAVGGGDQGGEGEEGADEPLDMTLTAADAEPVERLTQLGGGMWDAQSAALVYLACRRNEEVAANVLFDNGGVPPELIQALQQAGANAGAEGTD